MLHGSVDAAADKAFLKSSHSETSHRQKCSNAFLCTRHLPPPFFPICRRATLSPKRGGRNSLVLRVTVPVCIHRTMTLTISSRPGRASRASRRRRLCFAATLVMSAVGGTAALHQPHRPFDAGKGSWNMWVWVVAEGGASLC